MSTAKLSKMLLAFFFQEPFQVIVCAETLLIMDMVLYKHSLVENSFLFCFALHHSVAHARCVILLSNAIKRFVILCSACPRFKRGSHWSSGWNVQPGRESSQGKKWSKFIFILIILKADKQSCVQICAAEPCNSVSTGLQCEMDPVSQTQACDVLSSLGFSVVGWYHSHPSFHPNPSVRDINTQDQFQVKQKR